MTYVIRFKKSAYKEWKKLSADLQARFFKVIERRIEAPRVPAQKLRGHPDRYKIKLRASGYRLVYEVDDDTVTVMVIAVGKRDRGEVYAKAAER